jgi:hypothetical protein
MPKSPLHQSVAQAAELFVAETAGKTLRRVEAKIWSQDGMPLLCAVEAALEKLSPRPTAQELVWLSGAPVGGAHVLRLQAFSEDSLICEATHEFAA